MRNQWKISLLALAVGCWLVVSGSSAVEKDPEQTLMQAKLAQSQKVLGAIALEDYEEIIKGANQLKLLSLDANWQVLQTEEYVRQSKDFRRATDALVAAGEKKNLDGTLLAYFQLTQSCVSCHKYVRDQR